MNLNTLFTILVNILGVDPLMVENMEESSRLDFLAHYIKTMKSLIQTMDQKINALEDEIGRLRSEVGTEKYWHEDWENTSIQLASILGKVLKGTEIEGLLDGTRNGEVKAIQKIMADYNVRLKAARMAVEELEKS